ncbi:unnamed protein product [Didymodactylos carnosus]|uniref:Mitochondria-eating protein n=1 Tax=Didymodactylos carnosus TaxID=1234261 RepID=A0A813NSE6_9BILA|nr:unnamed protein product [Didymodactylos carnosus]CAF0774155.1 unnamed protein product [Didymodactylos carnosus]CAF3520388.1 unnamed protein product [Didymodactylos carnosus]CAF3555226.1 unnamed protein product [Didymodactylos carnosus]
MSAKSFLRRLTDASSFSILQEKLTRLNDTYLLNTSEQNVARCIDIIELNAKVQRELFKVLNVISSEGGLYGGTAAIKSRLLPFLSQEASYLNGILTNDLYWPILRKTQDIEYDALAQEYDQSLSELELELRSARIDNAVLEAELEQTRHELFDEHARSTDEKMFTEAELSNLRTRLHDAEFRLSLERYQPHSLLAAEYEREIRRIRDDINSIQRRSRSRSLSPRRSYSSYTPRAVSPLTVVRSTSPLSPDEPLQKIRESNLIQRFSDMFVKERLDAMDTLRTVSDDYDMNQRIIFNIIQEAFSLSKRRFVDWKIRLRSQLAITHNGPETLEEIVQEYINRNVDFYDLPSMVSEVIDNLHRNPRLSLPLGVTYSTLGTYIREACRVAWHMTCLAYPLDISFASDAEVFDDSKYRRSYDSEYSAPLGEACTKRGASLNRSRTASPTRRGTSRSVSPLRRSRATSPVAFSSSYRKLLLEGKYEKTDV